MARTLKERYGYLMADMAKISRAAAKIDETQVFQEANPDTRKYINILMKDNLLPGSGLGNLQNFKAFYDAIAKNGKHGLILMEHYSNTDLPAIVYMLEKAGERLGQEWALDLAKRIVPVAGMKLNEANAAVRAFAESYSRVVIYPTRSLSAVESKEISEEEKKAEEQRARKINFAAMRAMDGCKKRGEAILVFPSGTRARPGRPETKKGLREIDSYLRLFDVMILVAINGNCLRINPADPEDMTADLIIPDVVTLTASPLIECKKFRDDILAALPADCPDPKQNTVDGIMEQLELIHSQVEKQPKNLFAQAGSVSYPGRGIVAGRSADGKYAVSAYWTMGRSAGSRNRIFVTDSENGTDVIRTKPFDESLIAGDLSLIIYAAVRELGKKTIVTNGDQTDTIFEGLKAGLTLEQALRSRKYEHDAPNYTPRISSLIDVEGGELRYTLSILKSDAGNPDCILRQTFDYENPSAGEARYIHTYEGDGNPLPSFKGEPEKVVLSRTDDIDAFAEVLWNCLDEDNKVSLFVRFIEISTGKATTRIINKNK